jgi:cobalt-zinc-cadmium efflux system protein
MNSGNPHSGNPHSGNPHSGNPHPDEQPAHRPGEEHATHASGSHAAHAHRDHSSGGHSHGGHSHGGHSHGAHSHGHLLGGHGHGSGPGTSFDGAFAIGAAANLAFVVAEMGFGFAANSVALIADAIHNLGDVLGLLLGWMAVWLHRRPPTERRTYGWGRFSILAALGNAAILLVSVGAIGIEALHRVNEPVPVASTTVMVVAALGILVNGGSALLFLGGRHGDLNIRAQYLHLAADAGVSLGVVVAAIGMRLTGWGWLDPATSLLIAAVIAYGTWSALREAANLVMDAVPAGVSQVAVQHWLMDLPGVAEVHDLHIWALSTTDTALTAHLVYAEGAENRLPDDLAAELRRRFGIGHATVQIETGADAMLCRLRPGDVV